MFCITSPALSTSSQTASPALYPSGKCLSRARDTPSTSVLEDVRDTFSASTVPSSQPAGL